ncbi:MAG TPA: hypothetical protein VGJ73_03030 [Verrucomicrobiae bacterium]
MTEFNTEFTRSQAASPASLLFGRVVLFLFAMPFAAFGVFAAGQAIQKLRAGIVGQGAGLFVFALIFCAIGFGLMFVAITAGRRQKAAEAKWATQTDGGTKLWLVRDDWAAGKIKSSTGVQWIILLFMGAAFAGIGGVTSFSVIPKELARGHYASLVTLIFPLAGLGFIVAAARAWLARRRFGDCFFELGQIPAPLGGSFDGVIQTSKRLTLEDSLHLNLSCVCRTVSGSGNSRSVREDVLWEDEKVLRQDAGLQSTSEGGSGIPVHFRLPENQPESAPRGNPTIIWRLKAKSKMRGPSFAATFEVPVFHVAGVAASSTDDEADPAAPMQLSVEEIRRDEHSRIQVTDGLHGREFYFPAARNLGMALMLSVVLMVWSGFLWLMIVKHAPILFPIVFGLFELFLLWGWCNVWFKSGRVTVNSTEVTLQNRWLIFGRTRQFAAGDVARFEIKIGGTSGSTTYHDIKLVAGTNDQDSLASRKQQFQQTGQPAQLTFKVSNPSGVTVAGYIASRPEAEWLVREMNRALGREM